MFGGHSVDVQVSEELQLLGVHLAG
jgi:hypothetical protein